MGKRMNETTLPPRVLADLQVIAGKKDLDDELIALFEKFLEASRKLGGGSPQKQQVVLLYTLWSTSKSGFKNLPQSREEIERQGRDKIRAGVDQQTAELPEENKKKAWGAKAGK